MKKPTLWAQVKAAAARAAIASRNAPLFALTVTVSLSIEAFAMAGVFATNTATMTIAGVTVAMAWPEAAISASFTLLALWLMGSAAAMKSDPRPSQQDRARGAQWLAIAVMFAPIYYAGTCQALTHDRAMTAAYIASPKYEADLRASRDNTLDSISQREAAAELAQATEVVRPKLDSLTGSMLWIGLILAANMLAVRLGWRAAPEPVDVTVARALSVKRSAAAHQANATRKARESGELPRVVKA